MSGSQLGQHFQRMGREKSRSSPAGTYNELMPLGPSDPPVRRSARIAAWLTSLLPAIPTETGKRSRSRTSRLIRAATSCGGPKSRPVPVRSRKA